MVHHSPKVGVRGMHVASWRVSPSFAILIAYILLCLFTGGSSRADASLLLVQRPATILCLAALLLVPIKRDVHDIRKPAIMLAAFAATIAIQLVPLPPKLWLVLPGHAHFAEAAFALGVEQPWRPISLTPDLTLNALLALLPAAAVLIAYAGMTPRERGNLVMVPIVIAALSAFWGLIQLAGGVGSFAYLYRPTSDELPVGLFANRNHQAVMLAIALPALAAWVRAAPEARARPIRMAISGAVALVVLPVILATGSRAGMLFAVLGLIAAAFALKPSTKNAKWPAYAVVAVGVVLVGVVGASILAGRAVSIDRAIERTDPLAELRWSALPTVLRMTWDYMPFGIGFGAFDPIFRSYEPESLLKPTFYNRAHNDLLELILSGGIATLVVMIMFGLWYARRTSNLLRHRGNGAIAMAGLGSLIIAALAAASIVDYPVRAPLVTILFAIACCWLSDGRARAADRGVGRERPIG